MKYTTEDYRSISQAYDDLEEKYEIEFDLLTHDKNDNVYAVEVAETENLIIVGCLKVDQDPVNFFEDDEGSGTFKEFRSVDERDEFLTTLKKSSLFYLVDKYAHGNVHYSVSNTKNYPDQRWDVAHGCAVYIPSDYIQEEYKKAKKKMTVAEAKAKFLEDANSTLNSYSDYCNGEVYGYSVVTYDKKGQVIEENECWGYIGYDNANKEKSEIMKASFVDSQVDDLLKNIDIIKFSETTNIPNVSSDKLNMIHRNVDFNNVKSGTYTEIYGETILAVVHDAQDCAFVYHDNGVDKPVVARFEEWQKKHGVTPEQFTEARFLSDVKSVLRKHLELNNQNEKKLKV